MYLMQYFKDVVQIYNLPKKKNIRMLQIEQMSLRLEF